MQGWSRGFCKFGFNELREKAGSSVLVSVSGVLGSDHINDTVRVASDSKRPYGCV